MSFKNEKDILKFNWELKMSYKVLIKENTYEYDRYEEAFQIFKNACLAYFKENASVLSENGMPREIFDHLNSEIVKKTVSDDELLIVFRINEMLDFFANKENKLPIELDHNYEFEDANFSIKLNITVCEDEITLSIIYSENELKTNAIGGFKKSNLYFESTYGNDFKASIVSIDDSIVFDSLDGLVKYVQEK